MGEAGNCTPGEKWRTEGLVNGAMALSLAQNIGGRGSAGGGGGGAGHTSMRPWSVRLLSAPALKPGHIQYPAASAWLRPGPKAELTTWSPSSYPPRVLGSLGSEIKQKAVDLGHLPTNPQVELWQEDRIWPVVPSPPASPPGSSILVPLDSLLNILGLKVMDLI